MTPEERKNLLTELGELTYQRAKLQTLLNQNAERSNQIGSRLAEGERQPPVKERKNDG